MTKKLIIAGPCATESREQILESAREAKKRGVDFLRVNLWKPRTKPGFDGLKEDGLHLLAEVAKLGINPGLEVIVPSHAEKVIKTVLSATPNGKLLIWIGARNQNHYIQQEIAAIASKSKRVFLMVKNQPWESLEHWEGIIEHCLAGGIAKENLLVCHRGFAPNGRNPKMLRNIPHYKMAMAVKKSSGLPMIFDPSHIGGTVEKVINITKESLKHNFDGYIVEVHPNPSMAKTDAKQQLTWKQFDEVLGKL